MTPYWSQPVEDVLAALGSDREGLSQEAARARLGRPRRQRSALRSMGRGLAAQFLHPLVLILVVAAILSAATGDRPDAVIIVVIVALTGGVGLLQERSADRAMARLLDSIRTRARVRRDGAVRELPFDELVPGDVVLLSIGAMVPGDGRILAASSLQVDESPLTGESFPVEKGSASAPADAPLRARSSSVHQGTHVVAGSAEFVVVATGASTEVGRIGGRLARARPPTEFARSVTRFGNLLAVVSLLLVLAIFAANVALERPVVDSLLFSVALAVGLVPELLPAVVSVTLARGAHRMARHDVIVRRLAAIEDFGAVDVLCADKTGTLTEGRIRLRGALDPSGHPSDRVRELAWVNSTLETGYTNPFDEALRVSGDGAPHPWRLVGEIPYDFVRKRLSVVVEDEERRLLITKGQVEAVLAMCVSVAGPDGEVLSLEPRLEELRARHRDLGGEGLRTLGVAVVEVPRDAEVTRDLEHEATFAGLLTFEDPIKPDVAEVLRDLDALDVDLKVVTGDDRHVAAHVWRAIRGADPVVMTGSELRDTSTVALDVLVRDVDVFAEVLPAQKERIVHALRAAGSVVGFLGDGINDAPALKIADVGISVDGAADVAREAADLVLRRQELGVVANGIREGRRTMANTLEYVHYTTSANFGNMVSMAVASVFLPFLPLLPKQILLNNLLSDLPALTIASDVVDPEASAQPQRWRIPDVRRFMIVFGLVSSVFDVALFGALFLLTSATATHFRSAWFVGSVLTEVLVLLVLRTRRSALSSRPPAVMLVAVGVVAAGVVALPYIGPLARPFELVPPEPAVLAAVLGLSVAYVGTSEAVKHVFYRQAPRVDPANLVFGAVVVGLVCGGVLMLVGAVNLAGWAWGGATVVVLGTTTVSSVRALLRGELGVDLIAVLAMAGALALHELLAGAIIAVMLTGGGALERFAVGRARRELTALLGRAPRVAHRRGAQGVVDVDVAEIGPDDRLVVKPGEIVPVDGVVSDGAVLDESALTGEARPVTRLPGDLVRSGGTNAGGPFELRAVATAEQSTYAGIVRLVEAAEASKAPLVRLADRYATGFIAVTLALASAAWLTSGDPSRALAVLVVATPCPLLLAAPAALIAGVSRAARQGILVKGGGPLETLARVKVLLLDKTGTLTASRPEVVGTVSFSSLPSDELVRLAASLDQASLHPFGVALVGEARARGLGTEFPTRVEEQLGVGIAGLVGDRAVAVGQRDFVAPDAPRTTEVASLEVRTAVEGTSSVYVAVDDVLAGAIVLQDPIRAEAPRVLRELRKGGIEHVHMVTGDHPDVAELVGDFVGIDRVFAERAPEEKGEVAELVRADGVTAMVGDGINDAPALAAVDVGIAIGLRGGTAASEAADVVLTSGRLEDLLVATRIARRTRRIALQSVLVGMGASFVAMGFAAAGFVTPVAGAILQEGIDVVVLVNALRALGGRAVARPPSAEAAKLATDLSGAHGRLRPVIGELASLAARLDTLPGDVARDELLRIRAALEDDVLPHEREEQETAYPVVASLLGGDDPLGALIQTHHEIRRLIRLYGRLVHQLPRDGPRPEDLRDLRRALYGLHAVLTLHFAQEDELYSLLGVTGRRATGSRRGRTR